MRPARPSSLLKLHSRASILLATIAFAFAWPAACAGASPALPVPTWSLQLATDLAAIQLPPRTELGVHVHDLETGVSVSHRADERWYLASMVKLPVAIAVLRGVEAGRYTLDTPLHLRADDRVDGAGHTNAQPPAAPLSIRFLLEEMMVYSDNTATDMLIALAGLESVNQVVQELAPEGIGRITTLADVRRQVYGQLTPLAAQLRGEDLLRLHVQPNDAARLQLLSRLTGVPVRQFRKRSLEAAYAAYYASGLNAGRLDAYAGLVAAVAQGRALGREQTAWLLALMERTRTGSQRIKAGLPAEAAFAHKTGTQRRRTCDAGIVRSALAPGGPGVVVVACVRGEASRARAEAALREVGRALCRTVLPARNGDHAFTCPPPAPLGSGLDPAAGAGARPGTVLGRP